MASIKRMMMTTALVLGMSCGFAINAQAKVPADMQEFQVKYDKEAKTPEGTVKLWLEGIMLFQNRSTRDLGRQILLAITDNLPSDFERNAAHATFINRVTEKPYIISSYCAGATPDNAYKADPDKCEITVTKSAASMYEEGIWEVQIKSSGADSPRQIKLVQNGDHWKISTYPGIYSDVRAPKK